MHFFYSQAEQARTPPPERRRGRYAVQTAVFAAAFFTAATLHAFWPFTGPTGNKGTAQGLIATGSSSGYAGESIDASDADQLQQAAAALATDLVRNLADPDPQGGLLASGVVICSFVDLKKMTRTSSLGRHLAEQMMTAFQQYRYRVVELRQATDIVVQEKRGEFGLSRDQERLRNSASARAMLTGTYSVAGEFVFLNARVIDSLDGTLLSSASVALRRSQTVNALLADAASLAEKHAAPMYMKRLEM
jgi:TolB-like protein